MPWRRWTGPRPSPVSGPIWRAAASAAASRTKEAKREADSWTALLAVLDPPAKKSPAVKAAERIARRAGVREAYSGVFTHAGKYCVCDGYTLIRFNEPVPLPQVPGGLDAAASIETAGALASVPLDLPTAKEARALLRVARAAPCVWSGRVYSSGKGKARQTVYSFGDGLPVIDLEFLVDVLDALPGFKAFAGGPVSPVVFAGPDGDALVMPVKLKPEIIHAMSPAASAAPEIMTPEAFAALAAA